MNRTIAAIVLLALTSSAAYAHKLNPQGDVISLEQDTDEAEPQFEAIVRMLRDAKIPEPEIGKFGVLLRPSAGNWPTGHTITACFYADTAEEFRTSFRKIAGEWLTHTSLKVAYTAADGKLNICDDGAFEVRISNDGGGSESLVGQTRARTGYGDAGAKRATLNIDQASYEGPVYRFLVLHEFGHMLGLEHEAQNGSSNCRFDENAVYDFFTNRMPGNTLEERRAAVKINILDRYTSKTKYLITTYDPASIMKYYFPKKLFTKESPESCAGGQPSKLSAGDLSTLDTLYGTGKKISILKPDIDQLRGLANFLYDSNLPSSVKRDILNTAVRAFPVEQ